MPLIRPDAVAVRQRAAQSALESLLPNGLTPAMRETVRSREHRHDLAACIEDASPGLAVRTLRLVESGKTDDALSLITGALETLQAADPDLFLGDPSEETIFATLEALPPPPNAARLDRSASNAATAKTYRHAAEGRQLVYKARVNLRLAGIDPDEVCQ